MIQFNRSILSVEWTHNQSIVNGSDERIDILTFPTVPIHTGGPINATLSIQSVTYEDSGLYFIRARNIDHTAIQSIRVDVVGKKLN